MKTTTTILLIMISFLIISCSNSNNKKAFEFATTNDKPGGINLLDNTEDLQKVIDDWKKKYGVEFSRQGNDISVKVHISEGAFIAMEYEVKNNHVTSIKIKPTLGIGVQANEEDGKFIKQFKEYADEHYIKVSDNQYTDKSNPDIVLSIYNDLGGQYGARNVGIELSYNYMDVVIKPIRDFERVKSPNVKHLSIDYRNGSIVVPKGKIWVFTKKKVVYSIPGDTTNSNSRSNTCNLVTANNMMFEADLILNGQCTAITGSYLSKENGAFKNFGAGIEAVYSDPNIHEIRVIQNYDYQFLPPGTTVGVPYFKTPYLRFEIIEFDEYDLTEFEGLQKSLEFLKKIGYEPTNTEMVKLFNGR